MGRNRKYCGYDIPRGVAQIVCGVCADGDRRYEAVRRGNVRGGVLDLYLRLNEAVDEASRCVEPEIREYIIRDIAANRGYDYSICSSYVSKNTFYKKKRQLVYEIAKRLELI